MAELKVHPLSATFGAEVVGLDLEQPFDDDTACQLRSLFDDRGVLVFRGLEIDETTQQRLVYALLGKEPPASDDEVQTRPYLVSNREQGGDAPYGRLLFHCDMMWADDAQPAISLYGLVIEQPRPATMFASMVEGWLTLPETLRQRVQDLRARHGFENRYPNRGGDDDVVDADFGAELWTVTPVANIHPRTGRTMLYVSQQATMEIADLSDEENEELLWALFDHLYRPANVLEHEWAAGDLVVWDNLAVQHARETVHLDGPARTLRKVVGPRSGANPSFPAYSKTEGDT